MSGWGVKQFCLKATPSSYQECHCLQEEFQVTCHYYVGRLSCLVEIHAGDTQNPTCNVVSKVGTSSRTNSPITAQNDNATLIRHQYMITVLKATAPSQRLLLLRQSELACSPVCLERCVARPPQPARQQTSTFKDDSFKFCFRGDVKPSEPLTFCSLCYLICCRGC